MLIGFAVLLTFSVDVLPAGWEAISRELWKSVFDRTLEGNVFGFSDMEAVDKYCIRKLITNKKLLDTDSYNIVLNPTNLDVTKIECDELSKAKFDEMRNFTTAKVNSNELNSQHINCIDDEFKKENFILRSMLADVLSELTLSIIRNRSSVLALLIA